LQVVRQGTLCRVHRYWEGWARLRPAHTSR